MIIVDTGVLLAAVIVETAWLIAREIGNHAEARFIASIGRGELLIENLEPVDYQETSGSCAPPTATPTPCSPPDCDGFVLLPEGVTRT